MKSFLLLCAAALAAAAYAADFRTPEGVPGRVDDLGGGVWRVRLADGSGEFGDRGAVQALAAFMGEAVPAFGAPDGSRVEVSQKPFAIRFRSRGGRLVREITSLAARSGGFVVKGTLPAGEGVYGFGERLDRLNQRGRKILLCSSDGWNKSDTTYAPIPFFVTTSGAGVFVNDYGTMTADMGATSPGEWTVSGLGGRVDLYVWATDRMLDAVKGVHRLQGGSLAPPDWAAGPVVCRYAPDLSVLDGYTFKKYSRQGYWEGKALLGVGVKEMLARYEAMGAMPRALIMEGWSIEMFGDSEQARRRREALKACGEFLRGKGVKMLVYMRVGSPVDRRCPGFKDEFLVHADVFKDGALDRSGTDRIPDVYLTGININPDSGKVAGGNVALDITNPAMWDWYVGVVWKELADLGVSGVKIDFCEELPDDGRDYGKVRVKYKWHDPGVFDGAAVHHAYPAFFVSRFAREMCRMTSGRGGFMVFARGGGIGSGRNPYMWAGDQTRSWSKLDDQVLAVLNSGMSGMPFMSYDYGGYQYDGGSRLEPAGVMNLKTGAFDLTRKEAGEGEETVYVRRGKSLSCDEEERIFLRALGYTAFMPCMQSHGYVRNVYEFGDAARRCYSATVEMRERLLPYIRRAAKAAAEQGIPVVRPLVLAWQDDPNTYSVSDEFMLGDDILVAPVLGAEESRSVYLPSGRWKEKASGKVHEAGREGLRLSVRAPSGEVPVFRLLRDNR
ncbi:MAG: glycoside hydrolase family 31 protein [Kiritimatiellae bacterium]|nr:glycoside hydrolase family 31 protein [Kiritimatiellia bacterium]